MKRFFLVMVTCSLAFLSCFSQGERQDLEAASAAPVEAPEIPSEITVPADSVPKLPPEPIPAPLPPEPVPEPLPPPEPVEEPVEVPETPPEIAVPADPVPELPPEPVPEPLPPPEPVPEKTDFDYAHITEEVYNVTKVDVRQLLDKLNGIIRGGDYQAWVENLGDSYLARISSREFLDTVSQSPRLKSRGEPLRNAEDYFFSVVIPSRMSENDRVDDIDIEFVPEEEKIFAFRVLPNGQRRRLYELKCMEGTWKIVN
jgi:hypothetical protein